MSALYCQTSLHRNLEQVCFLILRILNYMCMKNYDEFRGFIDTGCGTHSIDPSESFTIRSPLYAIGYYPSSYDCTWRFFVSQTIITCYCKIGEKNYSIYLFLQGTSGCNPVMDCPAFNIADSPDCKKDYFSLSDGTESTTK